MLHAGCSGNTIAVGVLSALLVASIIANIVTAVYACRTRCLGGKTERAPPDEASPGTTSEGIFSLWGKVGDFTFSFNLYKNHSPVIQHLEIYYN